MSIEIQEAEPQRDVIVVVLGSGLVSRYEGSVVLPSLDEKSRIIAGLEVLKDAGVKHLIFTGGDVYKIGKTLAEISQEYATNNSLRGHTSDGKVNISTIEAGNTVEEMDRIRELQKNNPKAYIKVISNEYHLVAQQLCKKAGFEFVSAEAMLKIRYGLRHEIIVNIIDNILTSKEYQSLTGNQVVGSHIISIPVIGKTIYKIIANQRNTQAKLNNPKKI